MELLPDYQSVYSGKTKARWSCTDVLILIENERTALYQPFIGDSIQSGRVLKAKIKEKSITAY